MTHLERHADGEVLAELRQRLRPERAQLGRQSVVRPPRRHQLGRVRRRRPLCSLGVRLRQVHKQPSLAAKCRGYHKEDKQKKHHVYEWCHIDGEFFAVGSFEFQVAVISLLLFSSSSLTILFHFDFTVTVQRID